MIDGGKSPHKELQTLQVQRSCENVCPSIRWDNRFYLDSLYLSQNVGELLTTDLADFGCALGFLALLTNRRCFRFLSLFILNPRLHDYNRCMSASPHLSASSVLSGPCCALTEGPNLNGDA